MTSNRSYLLRALYEWISDNRLSPHLLVDANAAGVRVPPSAVRDGKVVLNISAKAVSGLDLGRESVRFLARFGGVSQPVEVPVQAVLATYAREDGKGMMFPADEAPDPGAGPDAGSDAPDGAEAPKRPRLRVVR